MLSLVRGVLVTVALVARFAFRLRFADKMMRMAFDARLSRKR